MKLKKKPPINRTYQQLKNHYLVEKSIAQKLWLADFEERKRIYANMYDKLFTAVPDHPRLVWRQSEEKTKNRNVEKMSLVRDIINKSSIFLEFAPGDCRFATEEVSRHVKQVIGVDISDQTSESQNIPQNFRLIIYDGHNLDQVKDKSVDIVFSDQLIEHLHPEETELHFKIVYRILKPGGQYIFRTPHKLTGPHDISQYFSNFPEGFHLKEWNYTELCMLINKSGYSRFISYWSAKAYKIKLPFFYFYVIEKFFNNFPKHRIRKVTKLFLPSIFIVAVK